MGQLLLEQEVQKAIKREGVEHPVLSLFDRYAPQIAQFSTEYNKIENPQQASKYAKENFGFFADAVDGLGGFSLEPLEILAIWSKVAEIDLPRYETARILACAHASAPFASAWGGIAKEFLTNGEYPERVLGRAEDLVVYKKRLNKVSENLEEIEFYRFGVRKNMQQLLDGYLKGGDEAKQEFEMVTQRTKSSPTMEFLGRIGENWGNGVLALYLALERQTSR